jgi:hypothetical protein
VLLFAKRQMVKIASMLGQVGKIVLWRFENISELKNDHICAYPDHMLE